jgi:hypothetical protein
MSDLSNMEKIKLEKLLGMGNGYVLNFSNKTMQEFFLEHVNKDIYSESYSFKGDSKAKRLRAFWDVESNFMVAKILFGLLESWKTNKIVWESEMKHGDGSCILLIFTNR